MSAYAVEVALRVLDASSPREVAALEAVLMAAPGYTELCQGRAPAAGDARDLLEALPPHCPASAKRVYGIYLGDTLIGCADVVRGWPDASRCHIGLLLLAEPFQGLGHGRSALGAIEAAAAAWPEVQRLRIGVVETNAPALAFWPRCGFRPTGVRRAVPGLRGDVIVMEKPLREVH